MPGLGHMSNGSDYMGETHAPADCDYSIPTEIYDYPLIFMCGISGSGKTTLCDGLCQHGYVRVSADHIIYDEYGAGFRMLSPEARRDINRKVTLEAVRRALDVAAAGGRAVVDSCMCKRMIRETARRLAADAGCDAATLYLSADAEVLRERLAHRKGSGPDDLVIGQEEFEGFLAGFEPPHGEPDCFEAKNKSDTDNAAME